MQDEAKANIQNLSVEDKAKKNKLSKKTKH